MKKTIVVSFLLWGAAAMAQPAAMAGHAGHSGHGAAEPHSGHAAAEPHSSHGQHLPSPDTPLSATLSVSDCWIRAVPAPVPLAGYFVVRNSGASDAKLTGASSPAFGEVMLHQTTDHGGMAKMSMAHDIPIPAGKELVFRPNGYHAMLERPVKPVEVGADISLEFMFDTGEKAVAMCRVKPAGTVSK